MCACAVALALVPVGAGAAGLPAVKTGQRPGPDALYRPPPASVPQLENATPWRAEPILISGTQAYRDGEWLYQDFLHDDHGAAGARDRGDPFGPSAHLFSPTAGTMTYPTDPVFAHNAADLVELRIRPLAGSTAFRVTLNTLKDPAHTAFTIALGSSPAPIPWPHGAGVSSPAQLFLTVHGSTAELRDAATGTVRPGATASVNATRRQVDVRVPHSAWNPGTGKHRVGIGIGLWDATAGTYLKPSSTADADTPGGASPSGAALYNVGPRFNEPEPETRSEGGYTIGDAAAGAIVMAYWWREYAQATALRTGDASAFGTEVDFGKLAARTDDESGITKTGSIVRIMASRHQFGQGIEPQRVCFSISPSFNAGAKCEGRFVGQLQPYALYVPAKPAPAKGYGLTLLLHSLSANYTQYSSSNNQSQFGDRGAGSLVATPSGRGPDGFYAGIAEADTFEVWADVARHYPVDADWVTVSGYSMGGFGTFRLLARWPDLFARGMSTVATPGAANDQLASLRNTPIMTWNAAGDELVPIDDSEAMVEAMTQVGIRFQHWLFPTADHLTLATNDEYGPAAAFLGEHRVDRSPPHVTYVVDVGEDSDPAGAVGDHAYWVSGLRLRDEKASRRGTIDARSAAFGVGDPPVLDVRQSAGSLNGGAHGPMPYQERLREWGPAPAATATKNLVLKTENLSTATIDATRSKLGCAPRLEIASDGPLELRLECAKVRTTKGCLPSVVVPLPNVAGRRIDKVVVKSGGRTVRVARGRKLRRLHVRRPTRGAFAFEVRARARSGSPLAVTLSRAFTACPKR